MTLIQLTDKNFLPPKGVKAIPVYSKFYNDLVEGAQSLDTKIDTLNRRAHHSMDTTHIVKHSLMAIAVYDYSVDGGATGQASLNEGTNIIPDNALIRNVSYDIQTAVVATGGTAGVVFQLPTDGNLLSIDPVATGAGTTGAGAGTPLLQTPNTWLKSSAARAVQVDITGSGTIVAGKVYCYIDYVVSELDASDYTSITTL